MMPEMPGYAAVDLFGLFSQAMHQQCTAAAGIGPY
jgi:hypothetical protein